MGESAISTMVMMFFPREVALTSVSSTSRRKSCSTMTSKEKGTHVDREELEKDPHLPADRGRARRHVLCDKPSSLAAAPKREAMTRITHGEAGHGGRKDESFVVRLDAVGGRDGQDDGKACLGRLRLDDLRHLSGLKESSSRESALVWGARRTGGT